MSRLITVLLAAGVVAGALAWAATIRLRGPAMLRRFVVAGLLSGASLAMIAVVASAA